MLSKIRTKRLCKSDFLKWNLQFTIQGTNILKHDILICLRIYIYYHYASYARKNISLCYHAFRTFIINVFCRMCIEFEEDT